MLTFVSQAGEVTAAAVAEPQPVSSLPPQLHPPPGPPALGVEGLALVLCSVVLPLVVHPSIEDLAASINSLLLDFPVSPPSPVLKQLLFRLLTPQLPSQFSLPVTPLHPAIGPPLLSLLKRLL